MGNQTKKTNIWVYLNSGHKPNKTLVNFPQFAKQIPIKYLANA